MYQSTKIIDLGSCAFRQPKASSHCRHIHGYRLSSKIWFACIELDENNWVMDFGGLKSLKESLEEMFDHTLVVSSNDPCLDLFKELEQKDAAKLVVMDGVGIEKFARTVFYIADEFVKRTTLSRVWVEQVEVWEHEKNSAKFVKPIEPVIVSQSFNHPIAIL
jgi:6-pyruvoyltetrahydropterin/6-carboxytetrahydropterin synthase